MGVAFELLLPAFCACWAHPPCRYVVSVVHHIVHGVFHAASTASMIIQDSSAHGCGFEDPCLCTVPDRHSEGDIEIIVKGSTEFEEQGSTEK